MRKSLILALTAIGGGASYAAGVTEVATGPGTDDPSTWRWQVSRSWPSKTMRHLDGWRRRLDADAFNQRYERYTPLGLPQRARQFALDGVGLVRRIQSADVLRARPYAFEIALERSRRSPDR